MNAMPTPDASFLLRALEPAVRPAWAQGKGPAPIAPVEGRPFDDLLRQAHAGEVSSGRGVEDQGAAGAPLEAGQLERLALAADAAEAAGAERALMLIDGRGLVMDVPGRRITGEMMPGRRLERVDAALYVPADDEREPRPVGPPGGLPPRAASEEIARAAAPFTHD